METLAFENEATKNCFLRISKQWMGIAHQNLVSVEFAYNTLKTMQTEHVQDAGVDAWLQNIVDQNVSISKKPEKHHKKGNSNSGPTFPGPMAVQMSRRNINSILENFYWITEKSDGIRCMMLSIYEKSFPCWKLKNQQGIETRTNILDNCALEFANRYCETEGQTDVFLNLEDGDFTFYAKPPKLVKDGTNEEFELIPSTGRSFTYVFDRKFQFYLCVDEFLFPTHAYCQATQALLKTDRPKMLELTPDFQKILIFDGEIVWNMIEKRFNYSIYDLVSFVRTNRIESCLNMRMQERINIISMIVNDYYYFYTEIERTPRAKSLKVLCKHFYAMKDVKTVLNFIRYDEKSGHYLYKNYNKNDGLVFTPDDPKFYKFGPGRCDYLLKWKWPDKLSIDFLVKRKDDQYTLYYSGGKDMAPIEYKTTSLDFGDLAPIENQGIAELVFEKTKAVWKVLCIRYDKTNGNSFPVISTTFENMMENITLEEIGDLKRNQLQVDQQFVDSIISYGLFLTFKLAFYDKTRTWTLQYHFKAGERISWSWYHTIAFCIGPKNEVRSELVNLCELMSRSGKELLVRCVFLPKIGYYKIVDFNGKIADTNSSNFLATLEKLTSLSGHQKKRKFEEDDSDDSPPSDIE